MKHTLHFILLCLLSASLMVLAPSCSTAKTAAEGQKVAATTQSQEKQPQKAKKKLSLWHWFGKKQKAYVFSCFQGEAKRFVYSYDGLIWKYMEDSEGKLIAEIPENAIVKRCKALKKYPETVSGTLEDGSTPQVMKISKYTYIYWNKAIVKKIGCVRTKYNFNNEKDVEDATAYISFPNGIHLGELYEIQPKTLQSLLGL